MISNGESLTNLELLFCVVLIKHTLDQHALMHRKIPDRLHFIFLINFILLQITFTTSSDEEKEQTNLFRDPSHQMSSNVPWEMRMTDWKFTLDCFLVKKKKNSPTNVLKSRAQRNSGDVHYGGESHPHLHHSPLLLSNLPPTHPLRNPCFREKKNELLV